MADCELEEDAGVVGALTVNLGSDCIWEDEFKWTPISQSVRKAIDGTCIVEIINPTDAAQLITLECGWQPMSVVENLITIRDRDGDEQLLMTLTLCDGRTKTVLWDHAKGEPLQIVPVLPRPDYAGQLSPDWYTVRLFLFDATGLP